MTESEKQNPKVNQSPNTSSEASESRPPHPGENSPKSQLLAQALVNNLRRNTTPEADQSAAPTPNQPEQK